MSKERIDVWGTMGERAREMLLLLAEQGRGEFLTEPFIRREVNIPAREEAANAIRTELGLITDHIGDPEFTAAIRGLRAGSTAVMLAEDALVRLMLRKLEGHIARELERRESERLVREIVVPFAAFLGTIPVPSACVECGAKDLILARYAANEEIRGVCGGCHAKRVRASRRAEAVPMPCEKCSEPKVAELLRLNGVRCWHAPETIASHSFSNAHLGAKPCGG